MFELIKTLLYQLAVLGAVGSRLISHGRIADLFASQDLQVVEEGPKFRADWIAFGRDVDETKLAERFGEAGDPAVDRASESNGGRTGYGAGTKVAQAM